MNLSARPSGLEPVQEINSPLCMGGCLEDGAFVLLQHVEPVADVSGVVVARFRRDAEVAAKERGPDFGDQFFAGVTLVAELLPSEISIEAVRVLCPVGHLVGQR